MWELTAPTSLIESKFVYQYVEYKKKGDNSGNTSKIACARDSNIFAITEFYGPATFKSDDSEIAASP